MQMRQYIARNHADCYPPNYDPFYVRTELSGSFLPTLLIANQED